MQYLSPYHLDQDNCQTLVHTTSIFFKNHVSTNVSPFFPRLSDVMTVLCTIDNLNLVSVYFSMCYIILVTTLDHSISLVSTCITMVLILNDPNQDMTTFDGPLGTRTIISVSKD